VFALVLIECEIRYNLVYKVWAAFDVFQGLFI
jgi:hypothetical protein